MILPSLTISIDDATARIRLTASETAWKSLCFALADRKFTQGQCGVTWRREGGEIVIDTPHPIPAPFIAAVPFHLCADYSPERNP